MKQYLSKQYQQVFTNLLSLNNIIMMEKTSFVQVRKDFTMIKVMSFHLK